MFVEAVGLFFFLAAIYVASTIWQNRHLPPGPFPLPVLGNLLSISLDQPYRDFANMARTYGKLFRVQMGSTKVIVINSYEIAKEALVTKAKDFAGRPPHFFGAIFGREISRLLGRRRKITLLYLKTTWSELLQYTDQESNEHSTLHTIMCNFMWTELLAFRWGLELGDTLWYLSLGAWSSGHTKWF